MLEDNNRPDDGTTRAGNPTRHPAPEPDSRPPWSGTAGVTRGAYAP
ncbi:hypothetical protein TPA0907_02750 [Micromonospora humidisoli]|nr:hypothetical protein TPA0907_02750 [Micromonospora sp. AKA109]